MPAASYDKCMTTGHGKYPPTEINATQSKVFVQGKALLIDGDETKYHGHSPNGKCIGNSKFFINGKSVIKIGDSLTDGDVVSQGSPKLFIN